MNVEIVSIGTELLLGETVDTNSSYIARQLRDIGANIYFFTVVGDNRERIATAIRASLSRADAVITTGGLGPTVDDMTRQAVADATGRALEFRPDLMEQIAERFRQFGATMSENNRVQAYIPAGAIPLHNRLGTAPCFIVESEQGTVISLPGVPREMKDILAASVIPYLRERMGGRGIIKALVLRTAGIGESQIDARIADLEEWSNPTVGLAAHSGQTDIRITARADSEAEADALIAQAEQIVRERVGPYIYGTGKELVENVFLALLRDQNLKLGISYTGPSPEVFTRRVQAEDVLVAAETRADVAELLAVLGYPAGIDLGTLDFSELVRAEAARLAEQTGADVVIAIVTHSVGTGIATWFRGQVRSRGYRFGGTETDAPFWASGWAIGMAWRLASRAAEP